MREHVKWTASILLIFLFIQPGAAQVVSLGDYNVDQGESVKAPLNLLNVTDFGTITVEIGYDSSVVEVSKVGEGNLTSSSMTSKSNNSAGEIRVLAYTAQRPGASGNYRIAELTLRSVGWEETPLSIHVEEFTDSEGNPLTATIENGSFTTNTTPTSTNTGTDTTKDSESSGGIITPTTTPTQTSNQTPNPETISTENPSKQIPTQKTAKEPIDQTTTPTSQTAPTPFWQQPTAIIAIIALVLTTIGLAAYIFRR